MPKIDIKAAVANGATVTFRFYRDGQLWYATDGDHIEFPVPIADIGNATFGATEKGIMLMRYMRKWNDVVDARGDE